MRRDFGIHVSLWTPEWTDPFLDYISLAGDLGFDAVEIPLMDPARLDPAEIRRRLEEKDLKVFCGTGLGPETDISSSDPESRKRGRDHLLACVKTAAEVGSPSLGGVIHSAWGKRGAVSGEERRYAADILGEVARKAAEHSMSLALECINRYESSFLNTAEQGLEMLSLIGCDNVGIHLDTYHMNIEELSLNEALGRAGKKLFHFHASGNNRGYPRGNGVFHWPEIIGGLDAIEYAGPVIIESYVRPDCGSGDSVSVWRAIEEDTAASLQSSLEYLRSL